MAESNQVKTQYHDPATFAGHAHWSVVEQAVRKLKEAGYQALLAGGCVRDLLMGRTPNDFDIATNATPDQAAELFPNALTVGKAFGVTIIPQFGFQLEIATFRADLEYKDGRRPEGVRFTSPQEDAQRRDFTINALFFDLETGRVIDYVEGQKDITEHKIRTVGLALERFAEDKLRILRAVRFAAQLEFDIVPETLAAIHDLAHEINLVSRERVRDELIKLLKSPGRRFGLELLVNTGLLRSLFPDIADKVDRDWIERIDSALQSAAENLTSLDEVTLALTLFVLPVFIHSRIESKVLKAELSSGLKLDHQQINAILFVAENLGAFEEPMKTRKGELVLLLAHPAARIAEAVARVTQAKPEAAIAFLERLRSESLVDGKLPPPLVTGSDAKALGFSPGPEMGKGLKEAQLLQLEAKIKTRQEALEWLKKILAAGQGI
jgi:poly(A) polymerase